MPKRKSYKSVSVISTASLKCKQSDKSESSNIQQITTSGKWRVRNGLTGRERKWLKGNFETFEEAKKRRDENETIMQEHKTKAKKSKHVAEKEDDIACNDVESTDHHVQSAGTIENNIILLKETLVEQAPSNCASASLPIEHNAVVEPSLHSSSNNLLNLIAASSETVQAMKCYNKATWEQLLGLTIKQLNIGAGFPYTIVVPDSIRDDILCVFCEQLKTMYNATLFHRFGYTGVNEIVIDGIKL